MKNTTRVFFMEIFRTLQLKLERVNRLEQEYREYFKNNPDEEPESIGTTMTMLFEELVEDNKDELLYWKLGQRFLWIPELSDYMRGIQQLRDEENIQKT